MTKITGELIARGLNSAAEIYEGPGDVMPCLGCGATIALPCAPYHDSEESLYGHGPICSSCARREFVEGDFIGQATGI